MTDSSRSSDPATSLEAADCRLLAGLFRFVASYFLEGPNTALEDVLSDTRWRGDLIESGLLGEAEIPDRLLSKNRHSEMFLRFFRIPGDSYVPPFEQAYRKGKATVESSAVGECTEIYETAGYDRAPFKHMQSDHVGHQARFVAALLEREADCLDRSDAEATATVTTWRAGFLRDHCSWWDTFSERIRQNDGQGQILLIGALTSALSTTSGGPA